ncbi:hypothetical protein VTL71DRAFT_3354 [Oculimacula yallundae]|uniref:Non-structural maintenance of chromosomes element 1 homolog n=1 Tax=Oculimacula yallundae TaxID=86028 RepID=A0ABR4C703_9HELO
MDASDHAAPGYNNGNRAFLQSMMARGTLTFREAKPLLAAIFSLDSDSQVEAMEVTEADLNSYISAAAEAISPFDYEIRTTQNQITKERVWAFVNSVSDPLTQMATIRTTEETFYIKRFLDAMFVTFNTKRREVMALNSFQALDLKKASRESLDEESTQAQAVDKGLTADQVEALLRSLADERWISRSQEGYYSLTPRALMELKSWLVETYNDLSPDNDEEWQPIKRCVACSEIITVGQRCVELNCNVRLHNICDTSYWASRSGVKKCPKCKTPWDGKHYVGQKAVTTTEEYLKGKRRSGVSKKRAAEPEQSEEEEEPETSAGASRRRRSRPEVETPQSDSDEE